MVGTWGLAATILLLPIISARNVRRVKASTSPFQGWPIPPGHPNLLEVDHANRYKCYLPPSASDHNESIITHFNSHGDYIGGRIKRRGVFEPHAVRQVNMLYHVFLPNFTKEKDPSKRPILLDIGGNVGVYTVCALRNGLNVISIEANPLTASLLVTNVAREMSRGYGGIGAVWNVGLGREDSNTPLCFVQNAANLGASRFNNAEGVECTMKLPIRSLPTVLDWATSYGKVGSLSRIFYMKMDIELMEEKVLTGSSSFLRKGSPIRPCMGQIEVLRGNKSDGFIIDNALKILRGHGYCIFVFNAIVRRVAKHGYQYFEKEVSRPSCHLDIPLLKAGQEQMDVIFSLMGEDFKECLERVAKGAP